MIIKGAADDLTSYSQTSYKGSMIREIKFLNTDFKVEFPSLDAQIQLRPTGVTEGKYNTVTVDAKGRVTAGEKKSYVETSTKASTSQFGIMKVGDGLSATDGVVKVTSSPSATNVTTNINGTAIASIFEANGTTVKSATKATNIDDGTL